MSMIERTLDCEGCPLKFDHGEQEYCGEKDGYLYGEPSGICQASGLAEVRAGIKPRIKHRPTSVREMSVREILYTKVWVGNRVPLKLWNELGPSLRRRGWKWSRFLMLLKLKNDDLLLYALDEMSWSSLVMSVTESAESAVGKIVLER